ncbi:MAG: RsmD family RNA methyltransferase [Tannerella sp.]|jgi:16S rRNA (guanine(966)-N(2))-methyltransferase RsmD|nr:RsmD family RNA methyltransferase [Tannerella sp.]
MRIISGQYGHRRFTPPPSFDARPTTDFAKENLFNVLDNWMDWEGLSALDLFAGTGSISFELLSRGCARVVAVEKNRTHAAFIGKVARELKTERLQLFCTDAFRYLNRTSESFDFVFADPPYALEQLPEVPKLVLDAARLRLGGTFVKEHPSNYDFSQIEGFREKRVYGAVNFSFFQKAKAGGVGDEPA